jgi:bacillithiol biosynthesis deacetylase BshB1
MAGFLFKSIIMKLEILAFGAHPDDVELGAGGILAKHASLGHKTGIIDITRGEMGTRGTPEIRDNEAQEAAHILNCAIRENLGLRDGFIRNTEENQQVIIKAIRKYQPDIVLCNAPADRHPDHGHASKLVVESCFLAGLRMLKTFDSEGIEQKPWRPKRVYHYIQFDSLTPDFVVDISGFMEQKMASIKAHASQFFNPESDEPETVISSKYFFDSLEGRTREFGRTIYCEFGEGLISEEMLGVSNLFLLS